MPVPYTAAMEFPVKFSEADFRAAQWMVLRRHPLRALVSRRDSLIVMALGLGGLVAQPAFWGKELVVVAVGENKRLFILVRKDRNAWLMLPKSGLSEGQIEQLRGLLHSYTGTPMPELARG